MKVQSVLKNMGVTHELNQLVEAALHVHILKYIKLSAAGMKNDTVLRETWIHHRYILSHIS